MEQSENFRGPDDFIGELPDISSLSYAEWMSLNGAKHLDGDESNHPELQDEDVISKETLDEILHREPNQFLEVDLQDTSESAGSGYEMLDDPSTLSNPLEEYFNYPDYYPDTPEHRTDHLQSHSTFSTSSAAGIPFSLPMEYRSMRSTVGAVGFGPGTLGNSLINSNIMAEYDPQTNTSYQPDRTSLHESNDEVAVPTGATARLTVSQGYENKPENAMMMTPHTTGVETQGPVTAMNIPQEQFVHPKANHPIDTTAVPVSCPYPAATQPITQLSAARLHSGQYTHPINNPAHSNSPALADRTPKNPSIQGQLSPHTTATAPMQQAVSTLQSSVATGSMILNNAPKDEVITDEDEQEEEIILKFSSVEEANDYRPDRTIPPSHDPTVPETIEEKKLVVAQLLKEMKGIKHAEDNAGMIKPFREGKHSMERMEVVCWNILDASILRQRVGPLLTPEEEKLKNKTPTIINSFRSRLNHILDCLRTQKTICKHLLDPFYLFQFVDDPPFAKYRVMSNKTLNKKKSDFIVAGKKVLGHSRTASRGKRGAKQNAAALSTPFSTPKRGPRGACTASQTLHETGSSNSVANNSQPPQEQPAITDGPQMAFSGPIMMHPGTGQALQQQMLSTPLSNVSYASTPIAGTQSPNTGVVANSNQVLMGPESNTTLYRRSPMNRRYHAPSQDIAPHSYPMMASPQVVASQLPTPPISGPKVTGRQPNSRGKASRRKRSVDETGGPEYQPSPQKRLHQ